MNNNGTGDYSEPTKRKVSLGERYMAFWMIMSVIFIILMTLVMIVAYSLGMPMRELVIITLPMSVIWAGLTALGGLGALVKVGAFGYIRHLGRVVKGEERID